MIPANKTGRTCSKGHVYQGSDPCPACWPGYRTFQIKAKVWIYPGMAGWHFVSLPKKQSNEIQKRFSDFKRGWGSLPVTITVGKTQWNTSIFPDKKTNTYLLPIKADVRKKEDIQTSERIEITIEIRV